MSGTGTGRAAGDWLLVTQIPQTVAPNGASFHSAARRSIPGQPVAALQPFLSATHSRSMGARGSPPLSTDCVYSPCLLGVSAASEQYRSSPITKSARRAECKDGGLPGSSVFSISCRQAGRRPPGHGVCNPTRDSPDQQPRHCGQVASALGASISTCESSAEGPAPCGLF